MANINQEAKEKFKGVLQSDLDFLFNQDIPKEEADRIIVEEMADMAAKMAELKVIYNDSLSDGIEVMKDIGKADTQISDLKRITEIREELKKAA